MNNRFFLLSTLILIGMSVTAQNSNDLLGNRVRVKFQENFDVNTPQFDSRNGKGFLVLGDRKVDALNDEFQASGMQRVFPFAGKFEERHKKYGLHLWYDITVRENDNIDDLVRRYDQLEIVSKAEPVRVYSSGDVSPQVLSANDPRLVEQWHYDNTGQTAGTVGADIALFEAWEIETGDSRVIVSVHDSGIDTNHPDLFNRLWTNVGEIPNDGIDNDNNGFVDDYYGYNFAAAVRGGNPSSVYDFNGHGTHTSGTIAAENNNGTGVSGVAGGSRQNDGVRIMMMRLGDDYGSNSIYNPAPSYVYAADMGAVISSNSWGGGGYDQSLVDAIAYFVAEAGASSPALKGGLVIMSSGNSSSSYPDYRADIDGVMMVSATNHRDQRAWYSNYGQWVDISAPGGETSTTNQGVLSTVPNGYGFYQGTSMACPHVSGGAALLASKAYGSGLTRQELFDALIQGANPIDDINPSFVGLLGSGRMNVAQSLDLVSFGSGGTGGELVIDPGTISTEIQEGDSETYTIRLSNTSNFDMEIDVESENQDWLDIDVINLSIAANSVAKFDITLNASSGGDLTEGELSFSFIGLDNLERRTLSIAIYTLGDPEITVQDTLSFGSNYLNMSESVQFTVSNTGTDYLEVVGITNSNEDYHIEFDSVALAPNEETLFEVIFTPSVAGDITDSLYFISNDPANDSIKVILFGIGNANDPPTLEIDRLQILAEIENGNRYGSEQLTITNGGDEELTFSVQVNPYQVLDLSNFGFTEVTNSVDDQDQPKQVEGDVENSLDNLGDLSLAIKSPVERERGLAQVGAFLWIRDANSDQIYQFDIENEAVTDSITSLAGNGVALTYDGEYLWEHDYRTRLIKYSLQGDSISQILLDQQRNYGHGIATDADGIWMSYNGSFVQLDKSDGTDRESFTNSYTYGLEGLISLGNRLITVVNGEMYEITKGSSSYLRRSGGIAGLYGRETQDITTDGLHGWVSFNNYGVLLKVDLFQNFLYNTYPSNFALQAGESIQTTIEYNLPTYAFDDGAIYYDEVQLLSNDPQEGEVIVPFLVDIEGAPQISVKPGSLLVDTYLGYSSKDTITIGNEGNEILSISSITTSDSNFEFEFSPVEILPNANYQLPISVELSVLDTLNATLTIASNDPNNLALILNMEVISYFPPRIDVAEESLSINLYESQIDSLVITVSNSGDGDLRYYLENSYGLDVAGTVIDKSDIYTGNSVIKPKEVDENSPAGTIHSSFPVVENGASSSESGQPLEDVLEMLNQEHALLSSLIPNRFDFSDGQNGNRISDGGNDMYDNGNYLSTNLGGNLSYTNGSMGSNAFVGDGNYFTAKYDGLFVFAAEMEGVSNFHIGGGLGADGGGSADGSVLSITRGGVEFLGFVKRVYGTSYEPSVNHLIIVPNNGSVFHEFDTNTNNDTHSVSGLYGVERLYYLLFASASGGYIDDSRMLEVMQEFLSISGDGEEKTSLAPRTTTEDYIVFDASELDTGLYQYNVEVVSNDPEIPKIAIPTSMTVKSAPVLQLDIDTVVVGNVFVGDRRHDGIYLSNTGSDTLVISEFEIVSNYFDFKLDRDTIPPGQSSYGLLIFDPEDTVEYIATLSLASNDPVTPIVDLPIRGSGVASTILSSSTYFIRDTVNIGSTITYPFTIKSAGTDTLDYRIVIHEKVSYNQLVKRIEEISTNGNSNLNDSSQRPIADYSISSSGSNRILLLGADNSNNIFNVHLELERTGEFSFVSHINVSEYSNLTLKDLEAYDAVLVWKSDGYNYQNVTALGNALADYIDQGGGVVTAMYENVNSTLGGRWLAQHEKYSMLRTKYIGFDPVYDYPFLEKTIPEHELLINVSELTSDYRSNLPRTKAEDLTSGTQVVATWNDGTPLIVVRELENSKRVDLGFHPLSDNYLYRSWLPSTDGIQILVNAMNYVAGKTEGRSNVDWITVSNYEVENLSAGDSVVAEFVVDTEKLDEGWTGARALFYSNDSRYYSVPSIGLDILAIGEPELSVPDSVQFGDISLGLTGSKSLTALNSGNGGTNILITIDSLSNFKTQQPDTTFISPFERRVFNFTYTADSVGLFNEVATIHYVSTGSVREIVLSVNVVPPGVIRLEPAEVALTVEYQGQVDSEFRIHNDGEGNLEFALEAFHLEEQLSNSTLNNTSKISFERDPHKGESDFRSGHSIVQGSGYDSFGYMFVDSNSEDGPSYDWKDISQSGMEIVLGDDDSREIELPFEFPLYGLRNSKIHVGSNGIVGVEASGITSPINQQIPFGSAPNGFLAPFWKDLIPGQNGKVYYLLSDQSVTIQYQDFEDYDQSGSFTFQVDLYKSGDILFQYKSMDGNKEDATIGLEDLNGARGLQIAFNTTYISDQLAVFVSHPVSQINPEVTSGTITPGDSLTIPFTYTALDDLGGEHEREISILSNDTAAAVSLVNILATVEGVSHFSPSADTLDFDSAYVNTILRSNVWFENDSVGVLKVSSITSSNNDFEMLLPHYEASLEEDETGEKYRISINTSTGRVEGEIENLNADLIAVKAFTLTDDTKQEVWSIEAINEEDDRYSIYDLVGLSNKDLWAMAQGEILLDVFTSANLDGIGARALLPKEQLVNPYEYSMAFPTLYKPSESVADTTQFAIESNAINTGDVLISGFGVGLKSNVSISVSTSSLEETLSVGDSTTQVFTISNEGIDSLSLSLRLRDYRFESNLNPIGFDRIGDKTASNYFRNGITEGSPSSDLGPNMEFFSHLYNNGSISVISSSVDDPSTFTSLVSLDGANTTSAAEFLQGASSTLVSIDLQGKLVTTDIDQQTSTLLAYLQGDDYWSGMTTDPISNKVYASTRASLYELDLQANSVIRIGRFGHYGMLGIAIDSKGQMYGYTRNDEFVKINAENGQSTYVGHIGFDADFEQDLAYNLGTDEFYMSAFNRDSFRPELRFVDRETGSTSLVGVFAPHLGTVGLSSLAFPSNTSGFFSTSLKDTILAPNQSIDISALFKSSGLNNGRHQANLRVLSNDLSNPIIEIPVKLEVMGNHPAVGDYTKEINFGLLTVMDSANSLINVQNLGEEVLVITLANEDEGFELGMNIGDSLRIDINQTLEIPVQFVPNEAKIFEHDLLWNTNDPESPKIVVSLSGAGERASQELELDMSNSHFDLPRNVEATAMLKLYSVGRDSISYTVQPDEDLMWLHGSSDSSFIASDDSVEYLLSINTTGVEIGEYFTSIILTSNDPLYDSLNLPITLSVYNQVPELAESFSSTLLSIGMNGNIEEYNMSNHFQDADGDSIYYTVTARNSKVNFTLIDDVLSMFGLESGTDTLDIIAHDLLDSIEVILPIVANIQPIVSQSLPDFYTRIEESYVEFVDLDEYFTDPDSQEMIFEVSALSGKFADINISSDNILLIKGLEVFHEEVTITATDNYHSIDQQFLLTVDDVLSSEELGDPVTLFPNPVHSVLTYEYKVDLTKEVTIQLVDLAGKVVYSSKEDVVSGTVGGTMNVSKLPAGIYMMKVLSGYTTIFANRVSKQ